MRCELSAGIEIHGVRRQPRVIERRPLSPEQFVRELARLIERFEGARDPEVNHGVDSGKGKDKQC
jgi:hypothetical protein